MADSGCLGVSQILVNKASGDSVLQVLGSKATKKLPNRPGFTHVRRDSRDPREPPDSGKFRRIRPFSRKILENFLEKMEVLEIWCAGNTPILEKTLRECRGE